MRAGFHYSKGDKRQDDAEIPCAIPQVRLSSPQGIRHCSASGKAQEIWTLQDPPQKLFPLQSLMTSATLAEYGSSKVASFQIKTGAEKNAYFPQGPKTPDLSKVRKGCFAARHMLKLRVLQGRTSKRRAC